MTVDSLLATASVVIPVASLLASVLNQYVRDAQSRGETLPAWLLHVAGLVNTAALNGDKVVQIIKLTKGGGK